MARRSLRPRRAPVAGASRRGRAAAARVRPRRRRQRADPGPDERVVRGNDALTAGCGRAVGQRQRGRPGCRRASGGSTGISEVEPSPAARAGPDPAVPPSRRLGQYCSSLPTCEVTQPSRGHPARVVVDDDDQRVLLLAGVAEDADHLVAVAEGVGVHVALGRLRPRRRARPRPAGRRRVSIRRARPARPGWPGARCPGTRCRTAARAQPGCPARRRTSTRPSPTSSSTSAGGAAASCRRRGRLLAPPGAEQLADHELGVQRAADGEQFPGRPQHLGEQRVGRRPARPARRGGEAGRPGRPEWPGPPEGSRRRLCGLTHLAFQIRAAACHA